MNMEDAVSVNAGSEDKTGYDAAKVEALVNSSLIGAELFAPESASCEVDSYVADIDKRLIELEQADFTETEVQVFIAISQYSAEALEEHVWQNCLEEKIEIEFCSGKVSRELQNPNDQWQFRLQARIKTLMISGNKVKRTPWEEMLFGASAPIGGVPTEVKLDEALIFDAANAREFLAKNT